MVSTHLPQRRARPAPPRLDTVEDKLPARPTKRRAILSVSTPAEPVAPTTSIDTAPLNLFVLSDLNVRKHYDPAEIDEMAESLAQHGQLQNLVAVPDDSDKLAVIAGGRRLRGFWQLLAAGRVPADHPVSFRLAAPEDGRETSLVENRTRVALNPVDEIQAYQAIVDDHAADVDPITTCARRQGVTRAHVERMLRLAELAPDILEALGTGRIDLAAAQAYGTTADRALQLLVFAAEERREFGPKHRPASIREAIRGRSYPSNVPQALYVGLDAYRAAGGRIDRDLFFGVDDGELLRDPALLDRLAREKATAELGRLVERDGYASGLLTKGFSALPPWPTVPSGYRIGGRVADPATMSTRPAFAVRPTAIGIYTLQGCCLASIGWLEPIAFPAPAAPEDVPPPLEEQIAIAAMPRPTLAPAPVALPTPAPGYSAEAAIAQLREQSIQRRAAALAARALTSAVLPADRIVQPSMHDDPEEPVEVLPDGDILVTIQVRVHPDELEAQRATAEAEVDDEEIGGGAWKPHSR